MTLYKYTRIAFVAGIGIVMMVGIACGDTPDSVQEPTQSPTAPTSTIDKIISEGSLYSRAINDPTLQEEWVRETLTKYGIENFFGDIIIITPENAHLYQDEYDRVKHVTRHEGDVVTNATLNVENFGTERAPLPRLYIPTEAFRASEGNLEALIRFHEGNHAWVLRNGFEFGGIETFEDKNKPKVYNASMLFVTYELEGIKEELERGSNIMTDGAIENKKYQYMNLYVQLWRYSESIKDEVNEMLRVRYFRPWMEKTNSLWVFEDPNKEIKYGGKLETPFYLCESVGRGQQCYVQFEFRNREGSDIFKLPLPSQLR